MAPANSQRLIDRQNTVMLAIGASCPPPQQGFFAVTSRFAAMQVALAIVASLAGPAATG
jgi:hypothetical protein